MSIPSGDPSHPFRGLLTSSLPYVTPLFAASAAIVPVFYGFVVKSARQLGNPIPRMSLLESLKGGLKAAPTIGAVVGTQMVVQMLVEKAILKMNRTGNDQKKTVDFTTMLLGSMVVGIVSAPALAVFNGQTMKQTPQASLKSLSVKQTGAILLRETSFLFSLRVSDPLSNAMNRHLGEGKAVEFGSAFVSGAIGSVIGHPADTALTLWQRKIKIEKLRHLMRGAPAKALAVGGFSVGYKVVNNLLEPYSR